MGRHNYSENTLPVYTLYLSKNSDCLGASSFPIFSFFCFGINYKKQPREKEIWLIGWSAAICVWVLVQVNIMNLVRCLFWIAICFLWRDKNICLATIRLYFASLTHAIRIYIVKYSDKRIVAFRPFLFSFFFPPIIIFMQHYFYCLDVNRKLNIANKFSAVVKPFFSLNYFLLHVIKSNLNQSVKLLLINIMNVWTDRANL